jgi:hypothetical protein
MSLLVLFDLNKAEPRVAFLNGLLELRLEGFVATIVGEVQLVEASVSGGKSLFASNPMDRESLRTVHARETLESLQWNLR